MSVTYNPLSGNFETKEPGAQGPAGTVSAAGDGSQGSPSISFASESNTGLYKYAPQSIAVSTGGTGRLFINSNGNVGIGATTIDEKLHLESSNANVRVKVESTGTNSYPGVRLTNDAQTYDLQIDGATDAFRVYDGSASQERLRIDTSGRLLMGSSVSMHPNADNINVAGAGNVGLTLRCPTTAQGAIYFGDGTSGDDRQRGKIVYDHSDNSIRLHTNTVEQLRIDSSGKIGAGTGTIAPRGNLHLHSAGATRFDLTNTSTGTASGDGSTISIDGGTGALNIIQREAQPINFSTSNTQRAVIDSFGRLLVGTSTALTSPAPSRFQVSGTDFGSSSIRQTRYESGLSGASLILSHARGTKDSPTILNNGDEVGKIRWNAYDGTDFECVSAEIKASIDGTIQENQSPSKLGFSTTAAGASAPTERVRITSTGQSNYFSSGGNTLVIASSSAASTTNNLIRGVNSSTGIGSGTSAFFVRANGNVQNATNSYGAISDAKLKENIVDASPQWDDIKNLRVRNYNFIEGQTHTQIGVVAQEVETVSPGLVTESPDTDEEGNDLGTTTKSVNYSVLYMKAVKALQEAMTKIEALEQRLTDAGL